mmetsp:Transcript_73803/g.66439  ORF Transcript_73803/g.66439 Transcript_73803/m.66439 type:complete len:111 (-) Transcript_73803:168-500(-)|eukprot:CAMPEP_0201577244 /NCGR_PEP_ID=MMETSP0190_2-20130828/23524_1 /ASSEMBLY_ACC=CAM_ASM_000263 /TAXON_ID=37353 /ORGANISM="Rosalina sp." /LENGTH=110 /DNA_ID=CAMNT_0048009061 /DNA_START=96 /DNA_END=428 /DNA_ORIENTATION=-
MAQNEENVILHKWSFNCKFEEGDDPKIVFTVEDGVTNRKWVLVKGKDDFPDQKVGEAYDKLQPELDACSIACIYPEDGANTLEIRFYDGGNDGDKQQKEIKYTYQLPEEK